MVDGTPRGPMGIGDILDETIRLYRQQALVYIAVMALTFVPLTILLTLTGAGLGFTALSVPDLVTSLEFWAGAALVAVVFALLYFAAFLLSQGAATVMASGGFLSNPLHLKAAFAAAVRHLLSLAGLSFLLGLAVVAIALVDLAVRVAPFLVDPLLGLALLSLSVLAAAVAFVVYLVSASSRPLTRRLVILLTPFGLAVYCAVRWSLSFQALLLEGQPPRAALGRSWRLMEGYWWRTMLFLILLGVLVAVLQYVPGLLLSIPVALLEALSQPEALEGGLPITSLVANLSQALGWIIFGAVQWLAATVYYYDLRIRKEAFDLELRARRLQAEAEPL